MTKKLHLVYVTVPIFIYEEEDKVNASARSLAAISCGLGSAEVTHEEIKDLKEVREDCWHDRPYGSDKQTIGEILYAASKVTTTVKPTIVGGK